MRIIGLDLSPATSLAIVVTIPFRPS